MSQLTTSYLISLARKKMLEAGTEILDDATLVTYAQFTYQDIYMRVFPNSKIKSAVVAFANGEGALPADFGTLYGDPNNPKNNIYQEVSIADFARATGNAITVQEGVFKINPNTITSANIFYYPAYADISAVQNPQIHTYFQELIIYGIMARAYEDLQDLETSVFYDNKYEAKLALKQSVLSEYEEGSMSGGVLFNGLNLLDGGYSESPDRF